METSLLKSREPNVVGVHVILFSQCSCWTIFFRTHPVTCSCYSCVQVGGSAHGSLKQDHASQQNAGSEQNRSDVSTMLPLELFPEFLSKICSMLDLPVHFSRTLLLLFLPAVHVTHYVHYSSIDTF